MWFVVLNAYAEDLGGYRMPAAAPVMLGTLREAVVINPGDEQLIGSFARIDLTRGPVQVGLQTGWTYAWNGESGWTRAGLANSALDLTWWFSDTTEDNGARRQRAVGIDVGWADPEFMGWSTVAIDSTGGTHIQAYYRLDMTWAKAALAWRWGIGVLAENPTAVPLYPESLLVVSYQTVERLDLVGELDLLPADPVPLTGRLLARGQITPDVTLSGGVQVPRYWIQPSKAYATAQLVARLTVGRP